jgi:hypothetical protein
MILLLWQLLRFIYPIPIPLHVRLTSTSNQTFPASRSTHSTKSPLHGSYFDARVDPILILSPSSASAQHFSSIIHIQNIIIVHPQPNPQIFHAGCCHNSSIMRRSDIIAYVGELRCPVSNIRQGGNWPDIPKQFPL